MDGGFEDKVGEGGVAEGEELEEFAHVFVDVGLIGGVHEPFLEERVGKSG